MFRSYIALILRMIRRNKIFSAINILGLSIGLAISFLIFIWVQDELSFDSFHEYADQIYRVTSETERPEGMFRAVVTPAPSGEYLENEIPEILDHVLLRPLTNSVLVEYDSESDETGIIKHYEDRIICIDSSFFDFFTYEFIAGDPVTASHGTNFIIISKSISEKYFGDENPIGKTLALFNRGWTGTVTGLIEDPPINSHLKFDILIPISLLSEFGTNMGWDHFYFNNYVRLQPGTDAEAIKGKVNETLKKVREDSPAQIDFSLQPLKDVHLKSEYDIDFKDSSSEINREVSIFSVIAVFILLLACLNFMMLSTARATSRALETGIRKTVGASRQKLVTQFLGESVFFAFLSFLIAILFLQLILPYFNVFTEKDLSLRLGENFNTWGIFILITLFTGIFAGIYPAFFLSSFRPVNMLKDNYSSPGGSSAIRKVLVILQFTISIGLIIGTLVVHNQLTFIRNLKLGYNKEHIIYLPARGSQDDLDLMAGELRNYPGITGVTFSSDIPTNTIHLWGGNTWEGKETDEQVMIHFYTVDYDFIPTLDIEIAEGRNFSMVSDSTKYIFNETAIRVFGIADPLGKWFDQGGRRGEIIGVIKDFHYKSVHTSVEPLVLRVSNYYNFIIIRLSGDDMPSTLKQVQDLWEDLNPDFPYEFHFLDESLEANYLREARMAILFNYFALFAILISCLGLFGLSAFMAQQRTKEIGIRKVMGASPDNILYILTINFSRLVLLANLIAWPAAWWILNNWLNNFSYRTSIHWWIFPLAAVLALAIAVMTTIWQAYTAALTNPAVTIKYE